MKSRPPSAKPASVLQPFVDKKALAGAVTLVADRRKVLSLETVGFADIAKRKPMRADSLFWIASMTKPVTGSLMMMLVDEGKVSLDDPVEKFLPEFKELWLIAERDEKHVLLKRPSRAITVRDILNHTSGMVFSSPMEPRIDALWPSVAVTSYVMTSLQTEPGTKYQYSNMGINTAGRIIEVVSGMSFDDFLHTRLLKPLGMKETTFWPSKKQLTRLAKTYKPNATNDGLEEGRISHLRHPFHDRTRAPVPAGGLFSTAKDMGRFCQMVLNGGLLDGKRYLSKSAVAEMTRKQTADSVSEGYGVGWSANNGVTGHGGALSTNMSIDTNKGLIYVFMVQHAGFPADGGNSYGTFQKAAEERFAKAKKVRKAVLV
ncbi:MAG: beta-lactamase family protein [Planctomycetes bacterium]|nr:beta-lactamase family protein [Planctomycetota bacterium]